MEEREVQGVMFLNSDRMVGKNYEIKKFDNEEKIVVLTSNVGGSNKYDCKVECKCGQGGEERRFVNVLAYPLFQTVFALSITAAISIFMSNAIEECNKYSYEATGDSNDVNTCEIDDVSSSCQERDQSWKDFVCSGECYYQFTDVPEDMKYFQKDPENCRIQAPDIESAMRISEQKFVQYCYRYAWDVVFLVFKENEVCTKQWFIDNMQYAGRTKECHEEKSVEKN